MGGDYPWPPSTTVQYPSFSIPLDSNSVSVLARGKQATGRVTVEPDQTVGKNEVTVDIAARYRDWDLLDGTTVCLLEKEKGELVVGVFVSGYLLVTTVCSRPTKKTPKRLTWTNRRTEFQITVKIPHQPASPVIELPKFEIFAPSFGVTFPDADKFVRFHNLTIRTSGMPVVVDVSLCWAEDSQSNADQPFPFQSVNAADIDIQTSNAQIHGNFTANSSLSLKTSNFPITANILLENECTSGKETPVRSTPTSW